MTIKTRITALECVANTSAIAPPELVILADGRVMMNHGGLILPPFMTAEEWGAAAMTQQAELCGGIAHAKP